MKTSIAVLTIDKWFTSIFDLAALQKLRDLGWSGQLLGPEANVSNVIERLHESEIAITSWDSIKFDENILRSAPNLKLVCHAAGSVKPIVCDELWNRKILVTSGARAIAMGVGEHCLGLMLSAMKNCYKLNDCMKSNCNSEAARSRIVETYGIVVGVIGCGLTGRRFIDLLRAFDLDIVVYDPYLSEEDATQLKVRKVALNTLLSQSDVISLHAPRLESTRHLLNNENLKLIKDMAVIINTASGWLIDEDALVNELKKRPIIAALDVTYPEPPLADSELRQLPNVILTPHIAGVAANNRYRIGWDVISEIQRFINGGDLITSVKREELEQIA